MKTIKNNDSSGTTKNVKDVKFWGTKDVFKLISKAWSEEEGWMKSTKAMEIVGVGCVVQVTTQQFNDTGMHPIEKNGSGLVDTKHGTIKHSVIAEAVTFVPGVKILESTDNENNIIERNLVKL